jgi:hypothetical protein
METSENLIGMHTMIQSRSQSRSQSMPVRGLCSGITREQAYSGNEVGMRTTHPNLRTGSLWERNWHAYNDTISFPEYACSRVM